MAAGFVAWIVIEPTRPGDMGLAWAAFELRLMAVAGGLIGLALGGLAGYFHSPGRAMRGVLLGAAFGAIGILFGYGIGGIAAAPFRSLPVIIWRTLAITGVGAGLGLGVGCSSLNPRRMIQGLLGGAIGGAVAGATFDLVGAVFGSAIAMSTAAPGQSVEIGGPARALTFSLLGLMVGLFTGLVEEIAKAAWIRLSLGRNEGREWEIAGPVTTIGRDERAAIPLFGDPAVFPLHATIERQGPHYILTDRCGGGVTVNGVPVQAVPLLPGAMIGIGRFKLEFHVRGARPTGAVQVPITQDPVAPAAPVTPFAPDPVVLVALDGAIMGRRYPIGVTTELGREGAGIVISDPSLSRRHARLSPGPQGLIVEDLGSTNGTFVGGSQVTRALLKAGDIVRLGNLNFRVEP